MANRLTDAAVYERIRLTDAAVHKLKPGAKRRIILDTGAKSLYLVIQPRPSGAKSWMMRFRRVNGEIGKIVLGPVDPSGREPPDEPVIGAPLSLVAARALATDIHRKRKRGLDVIADHKAAKHRQRAEAVNRVGNSFAACARAFVDEHLRARNRRRWREAAKALGLAYPLDGSGEPTLTRGGIAQRWADRDVREIDDADLHAVIEEAKRAGIPGTRPRGRGPSDARGRSLGRALSSMLGWLKKNRRIDSRPTIDVPPPPAARERVLGDSEIRAMWRVVDRVNAQYGAVLKLLLLTGSRLHEISELRRDEITPDGKEISLSDARTKNRRPHRIPLAPMARAIIAAQPRVAGCPYVFTVTGRTPIKNFAAWKAALDAAMPSGTPPWVIHDLRRTAVTGMNEIGVPPHVVEICVNHISGHRAGIAGTYNRAMLLPERRAALERWARRVQAIVSGRGRS